jgi:hypothetical protein
LTSDYHIDKSDPFVCLNDRKQSMIHLDALAKENPVRFVLATLCLMTLGFAQGWAEETASPVSAAPAAVVSSNDSSSSWQVSGGITEEYRGRLAVTPSASDGSGNTILPQDESDHDLRLLLDSEVLSPMDAFAANCSLGLWWDVDKAPAAGVPTALGSIYDGAHPAQDLWFDVYALSAEVRSDHGLKLLRGGRQVSDHGLPITFDGVSLRFNSGLPWLDVFAFGGRTVHFFEVGSSFFEDWIGSAGLALKPWSKARMEIDYRLYQESLFQKGQAARIDQMDHSYGLLLRTQGPDWLWLKLSLRGIDQNLAHTGIGAKLEWPELLLGVNLNLNAQWVELGELNEQEDPFFAILGPSQPHLRWKLDLWKSFEASWAMVGLHLGGNGRRLLKGDSVPFNRNFGRAYLLLEARDLGAKGVFVSAAVEGHYVLAEGGNKADWVVTGAASAGYEGAWFKGEAGTSYQRYRYDYYRTVGELSDVRSYYAQVAVQPWQGIRLRARYEFEWLDRYLHTITVSAFQQY